MQWGPAPGKEWTDGQHLFVLVSPLAMYGRYSAANGLRGDPMRMLFEGGLAPTRTFSHFYRWLRNDFVQCGAALWHPRFS